MKHIALICRALVAVAVMAGVLVIASTGAEAQSSGCPSVGSDFASTGPFSVTVDSASNHTYYSPSDLGTQGCDVHPVILWGNGTFTSPSAYNAFLTHLASHGFVVAAANTGFAGSGNEMLAGLDNLADFNADSSSRFYQQVDLDNVGATGHSQGGGGAVNAGKDDRVDVIFPLQPWSQNQSNLDAVSIFFAGGNDTIVSPSSVYSRYQDVEANIPAAYGELGGASHFEPNGNAGGYRSPATAWARWHLMGDSTAADEFVGADCGLCDASQWTYESNDLLEDLGNGDPGNGDPGNGDPGNGDPGNGDPGNGDPGDCVTATNSAHVDAERATLSVVLVYAVGSEDLLGVGSSTTSVEEISPGHWERVDSC